MRAQPCEPPQSGEQLILRASGGRDVRSGRPGCGDTAIPGRRISLHAGHSPTGEDGATEALTPAEARQLARALLRQAAAAEGGTAAGAAGQVEVSYLSGESYAVATRGHTLLTDQPATAGGADAAMTPTELLVASLSSCVAFYAGRYLARHGLNRDVLHVTAAFTTATDRPARVGTVRLTIHVPSGLPPGREAALLAVASLHRAQHTSPTPGHSHRTNLTQRRRGFDPLAAGGSTRPRTDRPVRDTRGRPACRLAVPADGNPAAAGP